MRSRVRPQRDLLRLWDRDEAQTRRRRRFAHDALELPSEKGERWPAWIRIAFASSAVASSWKSAQPPLNAPAIESSRTLREFPPWTM